MSQNDFNIANQGFPSFRSDLNDALQALASNSSGATEPSTTYAGQFWYDSTNDVLKFRNEANSAWIDPPIAGLVQALSDLGVTASAAELNKMDGVLTTTAELNYVDGVTSNIQTQLNAKGDITGVTAGSGISGGGTSGTVTVSHADTSSQGSVNNSGTTFIQDITLDTYGHITGLTSAAAAAGAALLSSWDPASTPANNFTSSGTWTKPSSGYADSTWVVFYLVGGGMGGNHAYIGGPNKGGSASVIAGAMGDLPSSVSIVVGAGGAGSSANSAGNAGGNTTISASGITFIAQGGHPDISAADTSKELLFPTVGNPFGTSLPTLTTLVSGDKGTDGVVFSGERSTYGGGYGGYTNPNHPASSGFSTAGTSVYAGAGGGGRYFGAPQNGVAPGGGGGGSYINRPYTSGTGGNGSVRVYYIT